MPEKLVAVFTPNRQSLSGLLELIRGATEYRKKSDDLRPLMIFPLPSRIEDAESKLQDDWRVGNSEEIEGYQIQFETILKDVYNLQECNLTKYFDVYKLKYVPIYSYGEEIAVLSERVQDTSKLAYSFSNFATRLASDVNPWEEVGEVSPFNQLSDSENFNLPEPIRRVITQTGTLVLFTVLVLVVYFLVFPFVPWQQFFYDLLHWKYFKVVVGIFATIDLLWVGRWKDLLQRINKLLSKPWVFEKDKEPYDPPLYPRELLEEMAKSVKPILKSKRNLTVGRTPGDNRNIGEYMRGFVFNEERPVRVLGYAISLLFFALFLIADVSVVYTTFADVGLISSSLPSILQTFEIVIFGGSLLSAIVGVWMLGEMSGKGELINTNSLSKPQKKIFKSFALATTFFSLIVLLTLSMQRLVLLGLWESSPTFDSILYIVLYGLLPINNALSAILTFQPAVLGFLVVIYILFMLVVGTIPILVFLADIAWRGLYIFLDVALWALLTPIIAIPYGISKIVD